MRYILSMMVNLLSTYDMNYALIAADRLRAGELMALPTETVYGLAGDASNPTAVAAIYQMKGRPAHNPLIVHVDGLAMAESLVRITPIARTLINHFWPGPLTLIMPLATESAIAPAVLAGGQTLAVRAPAHQVFQAVLAAFGRPLVAPSANRSGRISPTAAAHVAEEFATEEHLLIIDGGACAIGLESTVVDCTGDAAVILREGAITHDMLETFVPVKDVGMDNGGVLRSPGLLASHYAPHLPVRLNVTAHQPDEALLIFGAPPPLCSPHFFQLSADASLEEAAQRLYAGLRACDAMPVKRIAVMPIPKEGLGTAIHDRLRRAAAPRP